jgi:hypothetical protein
MAILMTNLRAEASAEAARVVQVRTLLREGEARQLALLEGGGVWLAKVRRTEARQALRGRFVLVWRVAIEDSAGRLVASTLLPVAVDVARQLRISRSRSRLDALVAELERATQPLVERAAADWQQLANRVVGQFPSTRLARERAIVSRVSTSSADRHGYQPGLFDRRVERERQSDATLTATLEQAMAERLLAVEQLAPVRPRPPRLLIVLVP